MSAATPDTADTVLLGGHRFWHVEPNTVIEKQFCDRITDVDMGDWTVNPTKVHNSEDKWQTFAPADIHYHDITITAHVDPDMDSKLQQKLIDQATGKDNSNYRFNLSIVLHDSAGASKVRYDYSGCMLTSVSNSPGDSHDTANSLKEILVVKPTRCDKVTVSA